MKIGIPEIHAGELSIYKERAGKTLTEARGFEIRNAEDLERAETLLEKINNTGISIQNAKGSVTRRLDEELENVREMFNPIEEIQQQAKKSIQEKISGFEKMESGSPEYLP